MCDIRSDGRRIRQNYVLVRSTLGARGAVGLTRIPNTGVHIKSSVSIVDWIFSLAIHNSVPCFSCVDAGVFLCAWLGHYGVIISQASLTAGVHADVCDLTFVEDMLIIVGYSKMFRFSVRYFFFFTYPCFVVVLVLCVSFHLQNYSRVVDGSNHVLLEFYAPWCGEFPAMHMSPTRREPLWMFVYRFEMCHHMFSKVPLLFFCSNEKYGHKNEGRLKYHRGVHTRCRPTPYMKQKLVGLQVSHIVAIA